MTLNPVARLNVRIPEWSTGERLRKARRELRLNQEDMAARLDVKRSTYEAWETGRNKPDMTELAPRLEEVTGISRLWFIGWADSNNTPTPPTHVTEPYRAPRKPHKWDANVTPLRATVDSTSREEGSGTQSRPAA